MLNMLISSSFRFLFLFISLGSLTFSESQTTGFTKHQFLFFLIRITLRVRRRRWSFWRGTRRRCRKRRVYI